MARRAGTSGTEELGTNGGLIFGKREPARSRSHHKVRVYKTDPDHLEHLVYRNTVSGTHRSQFVARTILSESSNHFKKKKTKLMVSIESYLVEEYNITDKNRLAKLLKDRKVISKVHEEY